MAPVACHPIHPVHLHVLSSPSIYSGFLCTACTLLTPREGVADPLPGLRLAPKLGRRLPISSELVITSEGGEPCSSSLLSLLSLLHTTFQTEKYAMGGMKCRIAWLIACSDPTRGTLVKGR